VVGFKEDNIQSFNRYAYANNNPYKFTDPDGRYLTLITNLFVRALAWISRRQAGAVVVAETAAVVATGAQIPSANIASAAAKSVNKVSEVARDGNVVELLAKSKGGDITVITEMTKDGNKLILEGTHIGGAGKGSSSVGELRELARDLGRQHDVGSVVVKGGTRTTGANPGKIPKDITIKVDQ